MWNKQFEVSIGGANPFLPHSLDKIPSVKASDSLFPSKGAAD